MLQEDPVTGIFILSSLPPSFLPRGVQVRLGCRWSDGAASWISSSCYPDHTISRNSGTLGRPLVVRQMFLPPPTGSSRPRTSSAKNRSRWSSANLGRRTSGRNRPTVFRPNWSQINRNVATLRPGHGFVDRSSVKRCSCSKLPLDFQEYD